MNNPEDHIKQIADYLKKNLAKGYTLDSLRVSLSNQGYSRISIEKAIDLANRQLAATAPVMKEKPQISYKTYPDSNVYYEPEKKGFFKKLFGMFKK